ncbi:hypothetical protein BDV29DRAFT_182916 [Aspergillus leporis]|jgi:hypothetical protein|uniref:Peptidase metallopeptidase domain-containing protein n=1 Tax=Aspergillus leporis TaxID=41062 RepID=A0A5N5WLC3_9EURO|nr:hypothetical protein BDV29DRAFT_182916 [Aspergillus leporis]
MPHQQRTINPERAKFFLELEEAVGEKALETLDPKSVKVSQLQQQQPLVGSPTGPAKYTCSTQKPMPATFAGSARKGALQVGFGNIIHRWKTGPNKTVNFATLANGYPKKELALIAANALNEAAEEWNALELGVQLKWVADTKDAAFVLAYAGDQGGVLAEAFFPNTVDLNTLNVYKGALEAGTIRYLKNIFLHELGHVLGFRHEFAPELEDKKTDYSVQIGPRDPLSVMGYEFPPQIQQTDIMSAKAFYQFPGTELGFKESLVYHPGKDIRRLRIQDYDADN